MGWFNKEPSRKAGMSKKDTNAIAKRLKAQQKEEAIQKKKDDEKNDIPTVEEGTVKEVNEQDKLSFMDKWKLKRKPQTSFVITMLFSNGTMKTFVIVASSEVFKYRKRWYYLRFEEGYYDLSHKEQHLLYHEDFAVPLGRQMYKDGDKAWFTVTPDNLKPLVEMEVVKALVSSTELNKYLKMIMIISISSLLGTIVALAMLYKVVKPA